MKLRLSASICLLALTTTAFANRPLVQPPLLTVPGKFYVGIFGGGGSSNNFNASQYASAYFTEALGGPLAVNAFGQLNSKSTGFFGIQLGYGAQAILLNPSSSLWTVSPGGEMEWYSMGSSTFNGTLINNTARLPEHDFVVSYPMSRNVFLANAVISFSNPCYLFHPYIGLGFGGALLRISGASALQVGPPEVGVNHYNANPSDSTSTFAGQFKLGLSYDINKYVSVFADYRWLYLGSSHFTFGSTIFPGHAETSSWELNLNSQRYNLGNVGVRFNF